MMRVGPLYVPTVLYFCTSGRWYAAAGYVCWTRGMLAAGRAQVECPAGYVTWPATCSGGPWPLKEAT